MATVTLTKSASGTSFTITNTPGGTVCVYPVGSVYMDITGNSVALFNLYTNTPIMRRDFGDVINGDDSQPFGDLAELQAYILANCFVAGA